MKSLPSCPVADVPIRRFPSGLTGAPRPAMRIADVMTPDPTTAEVSASVHEAARLMLDHRVGGLPVLHRGLLVGIITQADLVARLVPPGVCNGGRCSSTTNAWPANARGPGGPRSVK